MNELFEKERSRNRESAMHDGDQDIDERKKRLNAANYLVVPDDDTQWSAFMDLFATNRGEYAALVHP